MKDLSAILNGIRPGIKVQKKAPTAEKLEGRKAALSKMSPLGVFSAKLFKCDPILQDRNAVLVYLALCNHANKAGITECSQERLSAISGASVRTIARKIIKLQQYGLIRKEYSRPIRGNPMHRLNVMRIIHDDGTMTRQDVQNVASVTGHNRMAGNARANGQSYPQDNPPILTVTGQITVAGNCGPDNLTSQLPDKTALSVTGHPIVAGNQPKGLNIRTPSVTEYSDEDVFRVWRQVVRGPGIEVMPNEADAATCETLRQVGASLADIHSTLCLYFLTCAENGKPPAPRLRPGIAELLSC
jgi:hypothetical protein